MIRVIVALLMGFVASAQAADDPWAWWDARAKADLEIKGAFGFEKKSRTRRKPLKLEGTFALRRSGQASVMLMQFSKRSESGLEIDSTVLIDAQRWWTLTHPHDGGKAILEKVDLAKRPGLKGAVHALAFLHGKLRAELEKDFKVDMAIVPDAKGAWAFKLTPKSEEDKNHVLFVTVSMERETLKSLRIELPRDEWVLFTYTSIDRAKISDADLELVVPEGAEIVEDEEDKEVE